MSFSSLTSTHLITLERATTRLDASGGISRKAVDWHPVEGCVDVPVTLQPASPREKQLWAQRQVTLTHKAYVSRNLQPRKDDRVFVGLYPAFEGSNNASPANSQYMSVIGFYDMAGRGRFWVLELREQT